MSLVQKYRPFNAPSFPDRTWPNRVLSTAPRWCSVDLRDGNQALVEPMGPEQKLRFFDLLVGIGFKEIEVGFPSASQTDFDFLRRLVDEGRIPSDVSIQVLTQARDHLIERTFEAIRGAPRVIVHLYNSTSPEQRRVVFCMSRDAIRDLAVMGTRLVRAQTEGLRGTEVMFEYSPESFSATELEFSAEVCDAVIEAWQPTLERKVVINLPATVEMATPNVYADQIEWMHRHIRGRESVILSVHAHNDRGTAVAATELALLAGAERIEGTLFGNGERTGNVDLVTVALNMTSQGIDTGLNFRDLPSVVKVVEGCNQMPVPVRQPYAGELVFTAFSGSHQDAIRKGLAARAHEGSETWAVPYLPMDPADVGRAYEPLIRINSQSGKSGIRFVLERAHGYRVPKDLAVEFSQAVQTLADATGKELTAGEVGELFERHYLAVRGPFAIESFTVDRPAKGAIVGAQVRRGNTMTPVRGEGTGPIDAFVQAMNRGFGLGIRVTDYSEHAVGEGEEADAVAYVALRTGDQGVFGVGRGADIVTASLRAVVGAVNRRWGS